MPGVDAFGTQLLRDSTGAGDYVVIANVSDLNGPSRSRESIDVTAHNSVLKYKEFVKGLKDGGELSATINYDPREVTHRALDDDFEEDDLRYYQIRLFPDTANEWTWTALVMITDLSDSFPVDDRMEREATFKISGPPLFEATG